MNSKDQKITEIITEAVEAGGFFLIELVLRGLENNRIVEAYIDGEKNVTADDCSLISKEVNDKLTALSLSGSVSRIDISSPGVDRPLKFLKQYPKHINRNFELSYKKDDETKKFTGKLLRIEDEMLVFADKSQKEVIINFNQIKKAKVQISFS